ncbi:E3 ubiquitin-protein ligase RHA2B-like [Brassica rapa]|uniref:RING-type domain-containing protein n=1 Tax=Brassica campestris TaxID=3711 RepID=M4DLT4_BRACM|nr:E3 ubiquitin-protein ligase RHA2B-like [Brassica rapa]
MGLQGQLSDVSSDSIPLMLVALIATFFKHLRSFFLRFSSSSVVVVEEDASASSVYSGLANLADQLKLNRLLSYLYADNAASASSDCIVCLSTLKTGEQVRKLDCRHVFHKQCLEGWIQHLNFNCPLCRSPLIPHGGSDSIPLVTTASR